MPVNPLISLQAKTPDLGQTFSNALMNVQRLDQIKAGREDRPTEQARMNQRDIENITSLDIISQQIIPDLQRGNTEGVRASLIKRRANLVEQGFPEGRLKETDDALTLLDSNPGELLTRAQQTVDIAQRMREQSSTAGQASAKTEILESGATIQALPSGEVEVRNPQGGLVTGQDRADVLNEAKAQVTAKRQEQADITVDTTKRVEQVKKATNTADKAFGMVEKIRQNITNLKGVVPLVGQGADTGPIEQLFPSIKASTIRLEQLQKRLSLDVVGAVTFGALSKGELDLAKAVALPLGLDGDDLIQWANDTIAAKDKLANYFEDQAIFLSQGNTQADWLKHKKAELKQAIGGASESDIRATMKANNLTRPQVIDELKRRNAGGG